MSDADDGLSGLGEDNGDDNSMVFDSDDQNRLSEESDEGDTTDSDEDEEDTPQLPEQQARATSSKQLGTGNTKIAGISPLMVPLLQAAYPAWKAERGNKRKKVWKDTLQDFRILPEHSLLTPTQWDLQAQVYLRWMRRQGRPLAKKSDIFAAPKWKLRSVVKHEKAKRITEILQSEYGVQMGSPGMLERYQEAVTQAIKELSQAESQEMLQKVKEWNEQTPPDSVKARFATRDMAPYIKRFTESMWKRGGVRMVVLAGYKDEQNAWMTTCFDYNNHFDNGLNFRDAATIQGPWDRYIRHCFRNDEDSEDGSENEGGMIGAVGPRAKKENNNLSGEAALQLVLRDDGGIWMPDLLGRSRLDLQALVRAYLTAHYRKVTKNPKASAPFKKLAEFQDRLFAPEHLPDNFTFPSDPSHMKFSDTKRFLNFIRARQQKSPDDVFGFLYTLNREGDLVEVAEDTDDSDTEAIGARGKQHSQVKKGSKSTGAQPSGRGAASKKAGRLPSSGRNLHAEEKDAEDVGAVRKRLTGEGPPRARPAGEPTDAEDVPVSPTSGAAVGPPRPRPRPYRPRADPGTPNADVPNMGDEPPTRSSDQAGKSVMGKGKDVRRSKAVVEVARDGASSKQQPLRAGTSATSTKVGPPVGAKRLKDIVKAKDLPNQHSAPNGHVATTTDVSAGQSNDRQRSGPLKSALKPSTSRQSNETEGHIPTVVTQGPLVLLTEQTALGPLPTQHPEDSHRRDQFGETKTIIISSTLSLHDDLTETEELLPELTKKSQGTNVPRQVVH